MIGYKAKKSILNPNYIFHLTIKSFKMNQRTNTWPETKKAEL
tara:strand:- start:202029 stop:202154 length:126 start_codon:yes stop_codon:yes gene_type:complete